MSGRLRGTARAFLAEERGSLTIEFVLWVPVLMFWLVVSLVVYDAYSTRNKASKAAYTISDILSRKSVLDQASLEELYTLQDKLLPRAGADKALRVTNLRCNIDPDDPDEACIYEIVWSVARVPEGGLEGFKILEKVENIPTGLLPKLRDREEVLLVDMNVPFTPVADWVGIDAREWEVSVITRTRYVAGLALSSELSPGS